MGAIDLVVCIVGINQWEEYTWPCIQSILERVRVIVVDNASDPPYPKVIYSNVDNLQILKTERLCYSAAINAGFKAAGKADWYLSINNDTYCTGPFLEKVEQLSDDAVYGRQIITERGLTWFGNWLVLIPRSVWEAVGEFDENFKMCGFEDADYAARAIGMGFQVKHVDLPFHHYWGKTRWDLPGYSQIRKENMDYFEQKHGYRLGSSMVVTHG